MPTQPPLITAAHRLIAGRFSGILATHSVAHPAYPLGSLAPYCLDCTGAPLFLLSHLAAHTRNLEANPRMSLTVVAEDPDDVLQRARLSLIGDAEKLPNTNAEAMSRYFRYFPNGEAYFRDLNFRFHRLRHLRAHWVGGFGAARWIAPDRLVPSAGFEPAQEAKLLDAFNMLQSAAHREAALLRLGASAQNTPATSATAVGIDRYGIDFRDSDKLARVPFDEALSDFSAASRALMEA